MTCSLLIDVKRTSEVGTAQFNPSAGATSVSRCYEFPRVFTRGNLWARQNAIPISLTHVAMQHLHVGSVGSSRGSHPDDVARSWVDIISIYGTSLNPLSTTCKFPAIVGRDFGLKIAQSTCHI